MSRMSWKLGRVAGIDLYLHPTFLLLLAIVGATQGGWLAVLLVAAVFGCVLLHELGHALTARSYGIQTEDITLYPIGGVARLERMPRKPGAELLITLAGPAVNLVIAGVLAVALKSMAIVNPSWAFSSIISSFLTSLLTINLILAVFNMIPAFPMDGGRVFRALLSGWLGRLRATEIAAGLGRVIALSFGFYALTQYNLLHLVLAGFVFLAGTAELYRVRQEENGGDPTDTPRDPGDNGNGRDVWGTPPGQRWVRVGQGVWQLAPVVVSTNNSQRGRMRWH